MSKHGDFSGPYFPVFEVNTGEYWPEKTTYLNNFHTVEVLLIFLNASKELEKPVKRTTANIYLIKVNVQS